MISPEASAHEAARREVRDHPSGPPPGVDAISFARRMAEVFIGWGEDPGTVVTEVALGSTRALWVNAEVAESKKVLLHLHGGAYVIGTADHVVPMLGHITAQAGCAAISLDYRLAPEHAFPAAIEDAVAAYRSLLADGHDPTNIVVGGDSAGGGLSLAMVLSAREEGLPMPGGIVAISPWGDLECAADSWSVNADRDMILSTERLMLMAQLYLQGADAADPLASPVHADYAGLPPMYLQASGHETLLDDVLRIGAEAARAGVPVRLDVFPGMQHVFQYCVGNMPEADDAIARIARWIRSL